VSQKIYKAAIIGCGRIAGGFDDDPQMVATYGIATHAGGYTNNDKIEIVAVADIDVEKLKNFGERWKINNLYSDYTELLSKESVDILSICTWSNDHTAIFEAAVKSKVKVVWCEKPIADSLESAQKMVEIAEDSGVGLVINHNRRWDELYQELKSIIEGGKLGSIQQVSCYFTGGVANTCSHLFDVLIMLFGSVKSVSAWLKDDSNPHDPNIDGYVKFKNGVTATVQSVSLGTYLIFEFDIYGSNGRIRVKDNGFGIDYWEVQESTRYLGSNELILNESPIAINEKNMIRNAVKNIVSYLDSGETLLSTGKNGYESLELINAFILSSKNNGQVEDFPVESKTLVIKSR